tara:strand:- start:262 stop:468 length:207 start_codon:yes stop_codon:yes gene_type:complete
MTEAVVRKWGNSLGIVLSKEDVRRGKIRPGDKILYTVLKKADIGKLFGSAKTGMTGQAFKDMVRKGWK